MVELPQISSDSENLKKTVMPKKWRTFKIHKVNPMDNYFKQVDLLMADATHGQYWQRAQQEDVQYMNRLLVEEFKYRMDMRLNIVASVEGSQGMGKSLSSIYMGLLLGKIFGKPFTVKNIAFYPEELDELIENSTGRETFLMDEQQTTNVGIMSHTMQRRLVDFEEQLRHNQINLLFASPSLRDHAHYFVFKAEHPIRLTNPICQKCKKPDCENCKMPEWKRSGYPKAFRLLLSTKRFVDGMLVPRGYLEIPMPNYDFVQLYDTVKNEHIENVKKKESKMWDNMQKLADVIFQKNKDKMLMQTKKGEYKPVSAKILETIVYSERGMRYFTKDGLALFITLLKQKSQEHILTEGLNDELDQEDDE